ncbi:MAG: NADP-dependent oxidoreductase [Mycobacteriaceae bacterium]|nr:NADP-dependent oxidoreductase [Mycobacteriaceae bacterium]
MRAISFSEFGGPDVLALADLPVPDPGPGQVRVAVRAAGVNPADWKIRSGTFPMPTQLPAVLGFEVAGVVDAVGPGVAGPAPGDEVFGNATGGYAEFALSPVDGLADKPAGLSWADAASLPVAVATAHRVLGLLECKPGQTLLVMGAAGAVGAAAVQLARVDGATVIGTGSPESQEVIAALGAVATTYGDGLADRVRALAPDGVDAVFDASGFGALPDAVALRGGTDRIVTIADPAAADLGVTFSSGGPGPRPIGAYLQFAERLASGEFRLPAAARTFPLAEAAAAHAESEHGHRRGKVVLVI